MPSFVSDNTARGPAGPGQAQTARGHAPASLLTALLLAAPSLLATTEAPAIGETTCVSVNSRGKQANGNNYIGALSADGRFVAFWSYARNLVPGDTNDLSDVFVHDRQTHRTTRVSVDSDGNPGNGPSDYRIAISANGRFVAFSSRASNLVPGDTDATEDVFVHDRATHQTTRVSVDSQGNPGDAASALPEISANGRFVAFISWATNLVPGDTNDTPDVFVHDRETHRTTRASVDSAGRQGNGDSGSVDQPNAISADGRFVAFSSTATNLVPGDTNDTQDIFLHDRQTHQTTRVSVDSDGNQVHGSSRLPAISADGRFVAFDSDADNLVPGDTNHVQDVFVHDRQTGHTTRVSVDSDGQQGNSIVWSGSYGGSISADGRFVVFNSEASNLVPGDTNVTQDIFLHDRQTHQTTRVSIDSAGTQGNSSSSWAHVSADGRFVAFESYSSNLIPGETNPYADTFVHDRLLDRSASADLAISQTVNPSPFPASSPVTFTLSVFNNGPDPAGEVTLVDGPLRGQAVTSQGTCSNGAPLVCYLGTLAAGASATVTLTLPPRGTGTPRVYNAAQVSAAPLDPHRANNKTALHATAAP